jgi:undecaprenyl-diphosphatase
MSEEEEILPKNLFIFIIVSALVIFIGGLILLLLGHNMTLNEFFYHNTVTYAIFSVITYLGDLVPQILLVTSLWYAYDKKFAKNLSFALIGSHYSNGVLKDIFQDPRPWTRREVTGFGFPSGHSQNAVAVWGYLAYHVYREKKNKILSWIFVVLIYLIAFSRIVVGVHDLEDIWGGLLFGIAFLVFFIVLEPDVTNMINNLSLKSKIILAIIIPIILFIAVLLIFPNSEIDYGLACGALMGLSLGYLIECEKIQYDPTILETKQRIINLIIGLIITMILYLGLSFIPLDSQIWDFIQFFILAFLLVTVVPWIFIKIGK